ncbi:uncharacterized protein LOC144279517 isoform X3 [Eretmochelys imbricata]
MERGGAGAEGLGGPGDGAAPREGAPRRGLPPDVLRPVCGDLEIRHPARAPPEECEEDPRELAAGKPSGSEPEQERRQQLAQGVARLRGELQQLDLQTETAQREVMADEVSLEAAQERIRDAQRRSLLLKAYAARLAKERQQLQGSVAQLRGRLEQLKDISRKAKVELTVGGKLPDLGFAGLEPEVLEGWSRCEELWVKQLPLQAREQRGRAQLASLVQVAPAGGGGLGARDPRQRRAQLHRTWGRVSLE